MKKYLSTIILACVFLAGLLTFDQYGESWDDRSLQKYADLSLRAYATWPQRGIIEVTPQDLGYYGPFFVMFTALGSQFLSAFIPKLLPDLRHLIYFLTWFAGIAAFHSIAIRWLSQIPAIGATLLYVTQPLLWGHAFINPKDTPFLALFTISLALGFGMIDSLQKISLKPLDSSSKRTLALLTALWLVTIFGLFIFTEAVHSHIETLVLSARAGNTNIVSLIAKNIAGIPAETYIQRYFVLFLKLRTYYLLFITLVLFWGWYRLQPDLFKVLFAVLVPALLLGLTTSTRILGPFAGIIIMYYALRSKGKQTLPALAMYAVIAMMSAYLTWPYLWMNPVMRLWGSFIEMSSYPWFGEVLFNGEKYLATDLPPAYLPVLFAIQLTEFVWALALFGLILAFRALSAKRDLLLLVLFWFLAPVLFFIFRRVVLYDNFRQILFVLPPVFLLAGVAYEGIKNVKWQAAWIALTLLPGLFGIASLHPYEYIYYNSIVGGVDNVQGRFETDYWLTSFREAAEYLNKNASPDSVIWVEGPGHLYSIFSNNEGNVYSWSRDKATQPYDYAIISTRYDMHQIIYPDAKIVHKIERGGAVLTVIKKP